MGLTNCDNLEFGWIVSSKIIYYMSLKITAWCAARYSHSHCCYVLSLPTKSCVQHATWLHSHNATFFCVRHQQGMKVSWVLAWSFVDDEFSFSLRLISPLKSPPLLSCTTTCHVGVFPTYHIFLCRHQHIFLCHSHFYNLKIELTTHFVMHHNLPWISNSPHFSVSSSTHFSVSLSLLQVTRFRILATSRRRIGAITHGSCKEYYRKMDSMRARLEKKIKSRGSSSKVLDLNPYFKWQLKCCGEINF